MKWLKEPEKYFPPQGLHIPDGDDFSNSVCVGSICEKTNISQSTISHYLDMLQRAGLLESRRSVNGRITGGTKKTFKNLQNLSVVNFKSLRQDIPAYC